jgi:hypothetical protein
MRSDDFNQTTMNVFKRQSSLRPGDLSSIQEAKYKDSLTNTSNIFFFISNTLIILIGFQFQKNLNLYQRIMNFLTYHYLIQQILIVNLLFR